MSKIEEMECPCCGEAHQFITVGDDREEEIGDDCYYREWIMECLTCGKQFIYHELLTLTESGLEELS